MLWPDADLELSIAAVIANQRQPAVSNRRVVGYHVEDPDHPERILEHAVERRAHGAGASSVMIVAPTQRLVQ